MKKIFLLLMTSICILSVQPVFADPLPDNQTVEDTTENTNTENNDIGGDTTNENAEDAANTEMEGSDDVTIIENTTEEAESTEENKISQNAYTCVIKSGKPSTVVIRYGQALEKAPNVSITLDDGTVLTAAPEEKYTGEAFSMNYEWDGMAFYINIPKVDADTTLIIESDNAAGFSVKDYTGKSITMTSIEDDKDYVKPTKKISAKSIRSILLSVLLIAIIPVFLLFSKKTQPKSKKDDVKIELPDDTGKTEEDIRKELAQMLDEKKEQEKRREAKQMKRTKKKETVKQEEASLEVKEVELFEKKEEKSEEEKKGYTDDELFAEFDDFN